VSTVFADTSLLVAFISEKDELHPAAAEFMLNFEGRIVTTDWVLVELGNYLGRSTDRTAFFPFIKQLRADDRFRIVPASDDLFKNGAELYDQRPDTVVPYGLHLVRCDEPRGHSTSHDCGPPFSASRVSSPA
jgi:predicted nucleic acid-binding protein